MSMDDALLCSLARDGAQRRNATGTIERITKTFNDSTGTYDPTTASVYSGSLLVMPEPAQERTPEYGGEDVNVRRYLVEAARNTDVLVDDIVTVTDGGRDDDLTDATMTVVDVMYSSKQTARRMVCLHNRGG